MCILIEARTNPSTSLIVIFIMSIVIQPSTCEAHKVNKNKHYLYKDIDKDKLYE